MALVECKSFEICLSPKEILLWRQPAFTLTCYLILYLFIGLLEHQSVFTTCSLFFLTLLTSEVLAKEVCLRIFGRQLTYTDSLSTPMSPLSSCIQELWSGAGQLVGSLRQPAVAVMAALGCCGMAVLSVYMDTALLLSTLVTVVMMGPAMYYCSRYSHLAQAIGQFSVSICQPGLLDDEEEDSGGYPECGETKEGGSYMDIFKEEEDPKSVPSDYPIMGGAKEAAYISSPTVEKHKPIVQQKEEVEVEEKVSRCSSRRGSSSSISLEDYDIISPQEILADKQL